jgi:hypothetical protein
MALIEAGARVLGAKESDCTASNSRVTESVSGRSVSYGEIIQKVNIDRKFGQRSDSFPLCLYFTKSQKTNRAHHERMLRNLHAFIDKWSVLNKPNRKTARR